MATKSFPKSPKDISDFNEAQLAAQKTFKGGKIPPKGFKGYSANTTTEKEHGPYGKLRMDGSGRSDSVGQPTVKKDTGATAPRITDKYVFEKLPLTGQPQGLYHPIRGEGPPANSGA